MIFYTRKHRKLKTQLVENYNSLSMLHKSSQSYQYSQEKHQRSTKKINHKPLSTQKCFNPMHQPNVTSYMQLMKPQTPNMYVRIGTAQSRIKKRTMKKIEFDGLNFDNLNVTTTSWCLYDSHRKKYVGFREDAKRQFASLTKIMTTIVAIQLLDRLQPRELMVRITKNASDLIGTTANLENNHWINIYDLLYGAMLPSGNDAAHSLAEYIGFLMVNAYHLDSFKCERIDLTRESSASYVQQFLKGMNQKCRSIGLQSTWFSNPHGLQNALNTSSAKDAIKLSRYAMKNNLFKQIVNLQQYSCQLYPESNLTQKISKRWTNTNKLLSKGWQGVKTGHTISAGYCLSSLKDGIYIVVLNSQKDPYRFTDTVKIFDWYQDHINNRQTKSVLSMRSPKEENLYYKTQGSIY